MSESAERNAWALFIDEDTVVRVAYVEDQDRLVMYTSAGTVGEDTTSQALAELLERNRDWPLRDRVRVGLEGSHIVLITELEIAGIDVSTFNNFVDDFLCAVRDFAKPPLGNSAPMAQARPDDAQTMMIRV